MTDRDVNHGSQRAERPDGSRVPTAPGPQAGAPRPIPRAGKRADPTEPEVPSAKRVLAVRRQRSMLLVGSAIVALVSIALFLLYMTGGQVTTLPAASAAPGAVPFGPSAAPEPNGAPEPEPLKSAEDGSKAAPLPSVPRAKPSAHSTDIFRKPAF
jgi:hypothetical protein